MSISNRHVIGYFHICQKNGWERSFDLIFFYLKHSGLYDRSHEIRCGVVNDDGYIIPNERFNDPKLKIIVHQTSEKYERPTLLHMKEYSNTDPSNTAYYYLHTKGLRHYGTETEQNVIDWIKLLLYWNVTKWKIALNMLYHFDIYGCNACFTDHYSGNFWWANINHIKALQNHIEDYYIAPERWVCSKNDIMFNIYSCGLQGGHNYYHPCPEHTYAIPDDFHIDAYKYLNESTQTLHYDQIIDHYLNIGRHNNLIYKLPEGFDFDYYREQNNLPNWKECDVLIHYLNSHGNITYTIKKYNLPNNFNFNFYRTYYNFIDYTDEQLALHWITYGQNEGRIYIDFREIIAKYNLPNDFDFDFYKSHHKDFNSEWSNEQLAIHWINHGLSERRIYKDKYKIIEKYNLPNDFDMDFYRNYYKEFTSEWSDDQVALHWVNHGKSEGRMHKDTRTLIQKYNLPNDFDVKFYRTYNNLNCDLSDEQIALHWINNGNNEGLLYKGKSDNEIIEEYNLPKDFDFDFYRKNNKDLTKGWDNEQLALHWVEHGIWERRKYNENSKFLENSNENNFDSDFYKKFYNTDINKIEKNALKLINNRIYKYKDYNEIIEEYNLPKDFDFDFYRNHYNDFTLEWTNEQLALHWLKHGIYEGRIYKDNKLINKNILSNSSQFDNTKKYEERILSWHNYKIDKKRIYRYKDYNEIINKYNLPKDFDFNFYKNYYNDFTQEWSNIQLALHWIMHGKNEERIYKEKDDNILIKEYNLPKDFDFDFYRIYHDDFSSEWSNEQLALHWINYGKGEKRIYRI